MIMIIAWGGTLNLVLYIISMLGLGYYAFLTVLSPNTLVTRYDLGEKSVPIIRIVGTFVLPILILGIYLLFRGPEGAWLFFVLNFLVSTHQVILGWATRFKKFWGKLRFGDEIVGHAFVIIAIILTTDFR
ncbi:MAG: hypothetical protein CM15mP24_1410 [Candidatus Pelagibacterales bacterium]|nr:MAG: hypothetical protein CM15mP24_1410 [Pelagibacterales bacterium]